MATRQGRTICDAKFAIIRREAGIHFHIRISEPRPSGSGQSEGILGTVTYYFPVGRNTDNVNMVWHKAVAGNFEPIPGRLIVEDGEVEIVVVGGEEDILVVVTTLGYVVPEFGDDYSWDPWHG